MFHVENIFRDLSQLAGVQPDPPKLCLFSYPQFLCDVFFPLGPSLLAFSRHDFSVNSILENHRFTEHPKNLNGTKNYALLGLGKRYWQMPVNILGVSVAYSTSSGFLMPNFSRRYWRVRKVRPRSFAALVML